MDFFQELGKQTAKLMNNITDTMNEFSSIAAKSADSVGNIIVMKGQVESLKTELNRVYKELGQALVEDPNGNHTELIEKAANLKNDIDTLDQDIEKLKSSLKTDGQEVIQARKQAIDEAISRLKSDVKDEAEDLKDKVDSDLDDVEEGFDKEINKVTDSVDKEAGKIVSDSSEKETEKTEKTDNTDKEKK